MTTGTRALGYFGLQGLLGLVSWAYLVLVIATVPLMVLVIGLPIVLGVAMLGRSLAQMGLRATRWFWDTGAWPQIAPSPKSTGLFDRAKQTVNDQNTWRFLAWQAFNALTLPITLLAVFLTPVGLFWGAVHSRVTWSLLAPKGTPPPANAWRQTTQDRPTSQVSLVSKGGHGLLGMRERATALGGQFSAGPTAEGGFQVRASLPTRL